MNTERDKELDQIRREGEKLKSIVNSEHWLYAKGKLEEMIKLVDSISSLPDDMSTEEKIRELETRKGAISLVREWVHQIESGADQYIENQITTKKIEDIVRDYSEEVLGE